MSKANGYKVLGLMSGTSLDGLDMALCRFWKEGRWKYEFLQSDTIAYPAELKNKLKNALDRDAEDIQQLDLEYGTYLAEMVHLFRLKTKEEIDFVASHGHTVRHQPDKGITLQIGNGKILAELSRLPVVNNFRKQDVDLGGQGAPLVPIGDQELFYEYDACLNLGGFSNLSWEEMGQRRACDLSVCNMLLNEIAQFQHLEYDENGAMARKGKIINELLDQWNAIAFYSQPAPKSLGREWYLENYPIGSLKKQYTVEDLSATASVHIAVQINSFIRKIFSNKPKILVTGGGRFHRYLMEQLSVVMEFQEVEGNRQLIEFKEAMIFAFLGVLRWEGEINVLSSVTGASKDHCSGDLYYP